MAPTFIQLYHLLSIGSVLQPPRFGNCEASDLIHTKKITLSKENFEKVFCGSAKLSYREKFVIDLRNKLDDLIQDEEEWENADVFRFSDALLDDSAADCLTYYNTGFMCFKMLKTVGLKAGGLKCAECRKTFQTVEKNTILPVAELTNIRNRGKLIYPSETLYLTFKEIEKLFCEHVESGGSYQKVINDILTKKDEEGNNVVKLQFTCKKEGHKEDAMARAIHYYLFLRMAQYSRDDNRNQPKDSNKIKKQAKLQKT